MPMSVSLVYAPEGADPDDVFTRTVDCVLTFNPDGTMNVDTPDYVGEQYRPPDPKSWIHDVAATLRAYPVCARRLEGDGSEDVHLYDDDHGIGYRVSDGWVEVYLYTTTGDEGFRAMWRALRAVGREHSCLAFYYDQSQHLDLSLRARDARRRYDLI